MDNILEVALSLSYGLGGCYLPRLLLARVWSSIVQKDVSAVYQRVGEKDEVVYDFLLNQPLVNPPTVPSGLLFLTSVWLPLAFALVFVFRMASKETLSWRAATLRATVCVWAVAIGTSEGVTQIFKIYVQRRRPNFVALCGLQNGHCTRSEASIVEANLSFPSGHSSLAACGMTFLTLAVLGQLLSNTSSSTFPRQIRRWLGAIIALAALVYAMFVGTSRIVDKWHHPSDVLAGWLLGAISSVGAFHVWFPPLWHSHVGLPWSIVTTKDLGNPIASTHASLLPRTVSSKLSLHE